MGAAGHGERPKLWSSTDFATGLRGVLLLGRSKDADFGVGPYAETLRRLHPPAPRNPAPVRSVLTALGRFLLGSPAFTRHVVLDRWFLRA